MTKPFLKESFLRAISYPHVRPADFQESFCLDVSGSQGPYVLDENKVRLQRLSLPITVPGAECAVPAYDVTIEDSLGNPTVLQGRIPVMGLGSNSSKVILRNKFNTFSGAKSSPSDNLIPVLQGKLQNHTVVHGAFVGVKGTIPATLHRELDAEASVTIGFYTPDQFLHMTRTEPNYDSVLVYDDIALAGGHAIGTAVAYVAIWGGFAPDAKFPLALSAIPQTTDFDKVSTPAVLDMALQLCDPGRDLWDFLEEVQNNPQKRISVLKELAVHFSAPVNIRGRRVFKAVARSQPDFRTFAPQPTYRRPLGP